MCFIGIVIKSSFISHQIIHNGEKPLECDQYDKMIFLKVTFVNHQRMYSGEISYTCDQCDAKFSQKSSLLSQKITHTGEKACNVICVVNILHLK